MRNGDDGVRVDLCIYMSDFGSSVNNNLHIKFPSRTIGNLD